MTGLELNLIGVALAIVSVVGHCTIYFRWLLYGWSNERADKGHLVLALTLAGLFAAASLTYALTS